MTFFSSGVDDFGDKATSPTSFCFLADYTEINLFRFILNEWGQF